MKQIMTIEEIRAKFTFTRIYSWEAINAVRDIHKSNDRGSTSD